MLNKHCVKFKNYVCLAEKKAYLKISEKYFGAMFFKESTALWICNYCQKVLPIKFRKSQFWEKRQDASYIFDEATDIQYKLPTLLQHTAVIKGFWIPSLQQDMFQNSFILISMMQLNFMQNVTPLVVILETAILNPYIEYVRRSMVSKGFSSSPINTKSTHIGFSPFPKSFEYLPP